MGKTSKDSQSLIAHFKWNENDNGKDDFLFELQSISPFH